jgi:hypothetical protein
MPFSAVYCHTQELESSRPETELPDLPDVKFFYFSESDSEWAVSAEPNAFQDHLAENADSRALFDSMLSTVGGEADPERVRKGLGSWIEQQRKQFDQTGSNKVLYRKLEGTLAYLRAHDFKIPQLVMAMKRRAGASNVELVGVHLIDKEQESSFQIKVVLQNSTIDIGRQGFNINIPSNEVTDVTVVFALGVALYEIHEILNKNADGEDEDALDDTEMIEPLPTPALPTSPASGEQLQPSAD